MNTKHPFDLNRDDKHGPIGGIFEVDRFAEVLNDCAYVKKWPEIPLQQAGVVIEITEPKKLLPCAAQPNTAKTETPY